MQSSEFVGPPRMSLGRGRQLAGRHVFVVDFAHDLGR
jgi:hypothetical protein